MKYIEKESYDYVINKFHDTNKPFDSFNRFVRNDDIFDSSTGMDADAVRKGVMKNDEKYKNEPHSIRKARAVEFVLDNTRIACDPRDIFPAINCVDRPLSDTIVGIWENKVYEEKIPEIQAERQLFSETGASKLDPDYYHSVPIWDRLFELGFSGIASESDKYRKALEEQKTLNEEEVAFYDSIDIIYSAITRFIGRLANLAENTNGSEKMAKALRRIENEPPTTFYEAMLFDYIYFIISEHIDSVQVRSLGHFDRLFYPFYKSDMEKGVSKETLKQELAYFFMQFVSIGNYWGQPVYLGGSDENGKTYTNQLSYDFIEVYDDMGIYNPKVQIKYSKSTPKDFTLKVLDMIRRGHNSLVFVSEEHVKKSLKYNGVDDKYIAKADIKGCYEFLVQGGMDTEDYQINLLKPLEYALHGGRDGITGEMIGLECESNYETFEELFDEYKRQAAHFIKRAMNIVDSIEGYMTYINPLPMLSATIPSCVERAKDANADGGVTNNTYMCLGAVGTVADSLAAFKKFVFTEKMLSLKEFIEILDNNYEGNEEFHQLVCNDKDKYGNNMDLPDNIAKELVSFACDCIEKKPNSPVRGGWWSCSTHVARGVYIMGEKSLASADGRLTGDELSKNLSPTLGKNYKGITAAILSATKFDPMRIQLNPMVDAALTPSAVKGDDGLEAMFGLLQTYFDLGGATIQFNIVNADDLKKAQKDPEKYKDLQIRVSGWNVLFNNINKKEQDGFIRQAEMA